MIPTFMPHTLEKSASGGKGTEELHLTVDT